MCGSDRAEKAFDSAAPGFEVRRCAGCGLGRTHPGPSAAEIGAYYPSAYYGKENVRFNFIVEALVRLFRWRRARVIRRRVPRGTVLDVGCGRGFILAYLKGMGYEAHGHELSETAAWHARSALGLAVETGDFLTSPNRKGVYEAVIFWHSLEHFARPVEAIARAGELLKEGGLLAVAVPNFSSIQARAFGRHWFHLDVPRHYFHFTTEGLHAVLLRHGFDVIKTDHFSFEQNPYGWLQSFYNAMGFSPNFLYTVLKNRSARTVPLRRHPVSALLTVLLLPLLVPASLVLTLFETVMRSGGTIEVYAVKR